MISNWQKFANNTSFCVWNKQTQWELIFYLYFAFRCKLTFIIKPACQQKRTVSTIFLLLFSGFQLFQNWLNRCACWNNLHCISLLLLMCLLHPQTSPALAEKCLESFHCDTSVYTLLDNFSYIYKLKNSYVTNQWLKLCTYFSCVRVYVCVCANFTDRFT